MGNSTWNIFAESPSRLVGKEVLRYDQAVSQCCRLLEAESRNGSIVGWKGSAYVGYETVLDE